MIAILKSAKTKDLGCGLALPVHLNRFLRRWSLYQACMRKEKGSDKATLQAMSNTRAHGIYNLSHIIIINGKLRCI